MTQPTESPKAVIERLLAESTARAEAATPGPWEHDLNGRVAPFDEDEEWLPTVAETKPHGAISTSDQENADANHIAHSRTELPLRDKALLVAVEALEATSRCRHIEKHTIYSCDGCKNKRALASIAGILRGEASS